MVTVVKIGGSLFPDYIDGLYSVFEKSGEKLVLVNGGGEFANKLREYDSKFNYSSNVSHYMAIKCMDIIGELIADKSDSIEVVYDINDIPSVHDKGKIPLLSCSKLLEDNDELDFSWDVTSDSIACYVASKINAKLLILTNVDGIYNGNLSKNNKKLIKKISANELLIFEETCVDKYLPKLLIKYHLNCFIVNGRYPERVLEHLNSSHRMNNIHTFIGGK